MRQTRQGIVQMHSLPAELAHLARRVVAGRLELGVVTLPVRDRELDLTPLATDRVIIRATRKASKPINFISLHKDTSSDAILHTVVKVEGGA